MLPMAKAADRAGAVGKPNSDDAQALAHRIERQRDDPFLDPARRPMEEPLRGRPTADNDEKQHAEMPCFERWDDPAPKLIRPAVPPPASANARA